MNTVLVGPPFTLSSQCSVFAAEGGDFGSAILRHQLLTFQSYLAPFTLCFDEEEKKKEERKAEDINAGKVALGLRNFCPWFRSQCAIPEAVIQLVNSVLPLSMQNSPAMSQCILLSS